MFRFVQVIVALVAGLMMGTGIDAEQLANIMQPLTVALSVFTAAVLVRLARGMPTLDWKTIPIENRKRLTADLVAVAWEYAGLLVFLCLLLGALISFIGAGSAAVEHLSFGGVNVGVAFVGFLAGLCGVRMVLAVWRDLDIIALQKKVIDDMADQERDARDAALARENIEAMRRTAVKGGAPSPRLEEWRA